MKSSSQVFKRARPGLGTTVEISLSAPDFDLAQSALTAAFTTAARLELVFSLFDPASELARANCAAIGVAVLVSEDLSRVLRLGAEIEARSDGAFRLIPSSRESAPYSVGERSVARKTIDPFDLGGIAKGYVVDRLFEELEAAFPGETIVVNAGGDVRTSHPVTYEIRVPAGSGEKRYALELGRGALATSSQIGKTAVGLPSARFNPPRESLAIGSASVFAYDCATADALTKVALFGDPASLGEALLADARFFTFSSSGEPL